MGQYKGKVVSNEKVAPTVWKLTINVLAEQNLSYKPGQFVIVELPKPEVPSADPSYKLPRGYYSMASAPNHEGDIEFIVEHRESGGEVSRWLSTLNKGDKLMLEGPMGKMVLKNAMKWPQAFLGYRAGLAPLRAMIQAALQSKSQQLVWLFLGANNADDLLLDDEWKALAAENKRFRYVPSGDPAKELLKEIPQRKGIDLYLAGFKRELDPMQSVLLEAGFPKTEIYSESFG